MTHRPPDKKAPLLSVACTVCGVAAVLVCGAGCGNHSEETVALTPEMSNQFNANISRGAPVSPPTLPETPPNAAPGAAQPGSPRPVVVPEAADINATLTQMTRELRRWIVRNQRKPGSYEEFAGSANLEAPAPPPGKKYALSRDMKIILINR